MPTATSGRRARAWLAALAVGAIAPAIAACGGTASSASGADGTGAVDVVATTAVLGDLAGQVVGEDGSVTVLMGAGQDPHAFQLSARQAADLGRADLLVVNGLGLEAGLADAIAQAEADGVAVLRVGEGLDPLSADHVAEEDGDDDAREDHEVDDGQETHHADDGHDHGPLDPHVWLDVARMAHAPRLVADALDEVAAGPWQDRAEMLSADLAALDEQVAATIDGVSASCRRVATDHDVLGYLAARYGIDVPVTVIPGTSTEADPSARDFAAGIETVRTARIPVVVVDETASPRLADAFADDAGVSVLRLPLSGPSATGPGSEGYGGMMTAVADGLSEALEPC